MSAGLRHASALRPAGTLHIFDCDGPEQTFDTVMCVHCNRHWVLVPGSGRKRGYCTKCNGITCGSPQCDICVPLAARLDNWEHGRDTYHRTIVVPVTRDIS